MIHIWIVDDFQNLMVSFFCPKIHAW